MEQVKQIAFTLLRVFVGTLLASVVAAGLNVITWTEWSDWSVPLAGAGIAVAVALINALNPKDARYGIGASSE